MLTSFLYSAATIPFLVQSITHFTDQEFNIAKENLYPAFSALATFCNFIPFLNLIKPMVTKKLRTFFFLIAIIFIAAAAAGYWLWNKPHKNVKDTAAIKVAATELYDLFISDSVKAQNLYVDKIILVSGQVEKISVNQQSQPIILLNSGLPGAYINCTMENNTEDIKEYDSISIKGICSGYISGDADMGLPGDVFVIRGYLSK
jgi:tRNA_anti-like